MLIIRKSEKLLQRIFNAPKLPNYVEKICDMCTLLKYAKMRQSAKYAAIAYSRFSEMPINISKV